MFATKPSAALDLFRELGVEGQLIEPEPTRRGARICIGGKLVPIPDGFVLMRATKLWPMLTTSLLTWRGKMRWLSERWIKSSQARVRGKEDTENGAVDESVASFVQRRMGREILDRIVAPLSAGIYTADVTKLSMCSTMGPIYAMEREHGSLARATRVRRRSGEDSTERSSTGARYGQFRAFKGGMKQMVATLASALPQDAIRLNAPVQAIELQEESSAAQGRVSLTLGDGSQQDFDHVVLAIPPKQGAKLIESIDTTPHQAAAHRAAASLRSIPSASTAIVVLGLRRADITKDIETFGFVVPLTEGRKILAGSFASHKFAGRAPDGYVIARVFVGGAMQPELLQQDDESLVQLVRDELSQIIGLRGEPVFAKTVRWNDAMPQYHVGHHQIVGEIHAAMSKLPGLTFTSNALHGVGIAPVIAQAGKVASDVLAQLDACQGD